MQRSVWAADDFVFRVQGKNLQRFLNLAAAQEIRLAQLRWEPDGFTARAVGLDYRKLAALARQGGWQFTVLYRRGPGRWAEKLLRRPGIPLGSCLFMLLLQCFGGLSGRSILETLKKLKLRECGRFFIKRGFTKAYGWMMKHWLRHKMSL